MRYRLSKRPIYNRESYILDLVEGKSVLHLGAAQANDDCNLEKFDRFINDESFLHRWLTQKARNCVGIDYNAELVDRLRDAHGYENIFVANLEDKDSLKDIYGKYDFIIMGELIEHLSNPGIVLNNIRRFMDANTQLCITTPNAWAIKNWLFCMAGFESHDEDHLSIYSPRLLEKILEKEGFTIKDYAYYQTTYKQTKNNKWNYYSKSPRSFNAIIGIIVINAFLRVRSSFADGLIMIATKSDN